MIFIKKNGRDVVEIKSFATEPLKPCKHTGCMSLVRGNGYCDKHKTQVGKIKQNAGVGDRRESAEWHKLYNTKKWKMMRANQLLLQPYCQECVRHGRRRRATDVDHIIPHKGRTEMFENPENLQSLCHSCHSIKTIAEREGIPPTEKD